MEDVYLHISSKYLCDVFTNTFNFVHSMPPMLCIVFIFRVRY